MRKIVIPIIFVIILILGFNKLDVSAQEINSTIVLNPGATDSDSQNPMSPANVTIPAGTNVTWVNKDSSPHMLVSGTPDEGPNNIFYGDFFGTGENYTVTFDNPGSYSYYDPAWSHIRGEVTVESPVFSADLGSSMNNSSIEGIDDNLVVDSNSTDVIASNVNDSNSSENGSFSFPSSSFLSSFPSSATNDTSDQSSPLSSLVSDQSLSNIFSKVGPLLSLLMNGNSSSSSPLSSLTQSNESFGVGDFDNHTSYPSSTTQSSSPDQALSNIFNKVGPLLGLLMNGNSSSSSSPLSSLSQSNEMFDKNMTDIANVSTSAFEGDQSTDGNSGSIINQTFTVQNGSINSSDEERSKVLEELVSAIKKSYINGVDIPELPSSFDEGDSYVYVKLNVIDSGDKKVNASNFEINHQTDGSIFDAGSAFINDGGLFIRLHAK